jgi:DNA-binding MarR family transcriptional regulator
MTERTKLLLRENKIMSQTGRLYTKLNNFLKDDGDVTQILYAIYMEEGQTQKQISDGYGIPPQTVNNVVLEMQKNGHVVLEEDEKDKRRKKIKFTEKGQEFAKEKIGTILSLEKKAISAMGIENYKKIVELQELYYSSFKTEIEKFMKSQKKEK